PHFLQERLDSVDHLLLCFPSRQSFGSIPTFFAIAFCPETQRLTSQQSEAVRQAPLQCVSGERNRLGEGIQLGIEVKRIPCKPATSIVWRQQKKCLPLRVCTRKSKDQKRRCESVFAVRRDFLSRSSKHIALWLVLALVLFMIFSILANNTSANRKLSSANLWRPWIAATFEKS